MEKTYSLEIEIRAGLRLKVMRVIEMDPEVSQREIAREWSVFPGGLNSVTQTLVDRGFVQTENF